MIAFAVSRGQQRGESFSLGTSACKLFLHLSTRSGGITLLLAQGCQLCFDPGFFLSDFFERLFGLGLAGSDGRGFSP